MSVVHRELILLLLACCPLAGCITAREDERIVSGAPSSPALDTPLTPAGSQAILIERSRDTLGAQIVGKTGNMWYEWQLADGRSIAIDDAAIKCDVFRIENGFMPPQGRYTFDRSSRYHDTFLGVEVRALHGVDTIIAIDPLVCVRTDGVIRYSDIPHEAGYGPLAWSEVAEDGIRIFLALHWGMAYGTRVRYTDHLMWYSPDLDVTLQPVASGSDGNPEIVVPWGVLHFTRDGEDWKVTATVSRDLAAGLVDAEPTH